MSNSFSRQEWFILAAMIGMEVALGLTVLLIYKGIARHPWMFVSGTIGVGVTVVYLIWGYWRGSRTDRRNSVLAVTTNLCAVVLLALVGEVIVRIGAIPSSQGLSFAGTRLVPQDWKATADWNRALIRRSPANISYFTEDSLLGWTVGPSRASKDGLYLSSREGIRSGAVGVALADRRDLPRVALVGDSYTFGLEVPYELTWGRQLEVSMSIPIQVLNFGVDGYGVDQSYLRYHRDVRPWHPDIVIFGFINHDLYRTVIVYPFVSMPEWLIPFSKPRFIVSEKTLKLVNVPLADSNTLLSAKSIEELPFVEYGPSYDPESWKWKWYHKSYLIRFLFAAFPRWASPSQLAMPEMIATINGEILLAFMNEVQSEGADPLIVYFPNRWDFEGNADLAAKLLLFDQLTKRNIPVQDLTSCLAKLSVSKLFFQDERHHYTPEGNAMVAECLLPIVGERVYHKVAASRLKRGFSSGGHPSLIQ